MNFLKKSNMAKDYIKKEKKKEERKGKKTGLNLFFK